MIGLAAYRAVEVASEPVTPHEPWRLLPDASVFGVDPDYRLRIESLRVPAQSTPRSAGSARPAFPAALWADALA